MADTTEPIVLAVFSKLLTILFQRCVEVTAFNTRHRTQNRADGYLHINFSKFYAGECKLVEKILACIKETLCKGRFIEKIKLGSANLNAVGGNYIEWPNYLESEDNMRLPKPWRKTDLIGSDEVDAHNFVEGSSRLFTLHYSLQVDEKVCNLDGTHGAEENVIQHLTDLHLEALHSDIFTLCGGNTVQTCKIFSQLKPRAKFFPYEIDLHSPGQDYFFSSHVVRMLTKTHPDLSAKIASQMHNMVKPNARGEYKEMFDSTAYEDVVG